MNIKSITLAHELFQHLFSCSECNSEWLDCIKDDEEYLTRNGFYADCDAGDECFDDRCPVTREEDSYPGYLTNIENKPGLREDRVGRRFRTRRPKRQLSGEKFDSFTQTCRVLRSKKGKLRRRCDRLISKRKTRYTRAALFKPKENFNIDEGIGI